MAIWQFNIYLIPKQSLLNRFDEIPEQLYIDHEGWSDHLRNGDLDDKPVFEDALSIFWWVDIQIPFNPILFLEFGNIQDWTKDAVDCKNYGNPDTNDLYVSFDEKENYIQEIGCRIDLRNIDKRFVGSLFSLAVKFDCMLMDRKGRLFQPSFADLFRSVELSNPNRFVNDPGQFLDDLSKGIVEPE